jgi:hypothetical protein
MSANVHRVFSIDPIFNPCYALPYINLITKFKKKPCMIAEFRTDTNKHCFDDKTASWWHVLTHINKLTQYENSATYSVVRIMINKQNCQFFLEKCSPGDHFEFLPNSLPAFHSPVWN